MDFGVIQSLAKCIVRPPRMNYDVSDLGPSSFQYRNRYYQRDDFSVINNRGLELKCSYFKDRYSPSARECILFLHANSSSRLVVKNYIDIFMPYFDLMCFDFAGCGKSQGQYITLGYNEKEDVHCVIRKIRQKFGVKDIILWGRSMGASTALLFGAKYGGVKAIICDNSFCDLELLAKEMSDGYIPFLPNFLINKILNDIQEYIEQNVWRREHTEFNIRKLKPLQIINKIQCPIFFIGSIHDDFVNVQHTKRLHELYQNYKIIQMVKGNHNDTRSDDLKEKILKFLVDLNFLQIKDKLFKKSRTSIFQIKKSFETTKTYEYYSPLNRKISSQYSSNPDEVYNKISSKNEQIENIKEKRSDSRARKRKKIFDQFESTNAKVKK